MMEKVFQELLQQLQALLTLHRQLLDLLRAEREALIAADIEQIESHALQKQGLLDLIVRADDLRLKLVAALAEHERRDPKGLTLSQIAILAQASDIKLGDRFRSVQQALSVTLTRVEEQGTHNRALVEKSLEAVVQMKRNIVGGEAPQSGTYSAKGQKSAPTAGARLISREV
jgi:hypothetical protein